MLEAVVATTFSDYMLYYDKGSDRTEYRVKMASRRFARSSWRKDDAMMLGDTKAEERKRRQTAPS